MFDIVGNDVVIDSDTLSIPPYSEFWINSKDKRHATNIIRYVVFKHKWNTKYSSYSEEVREKILKEDIFKDPSYELSKEELEFEKRYVEMTHTPMIRLLKAAEEGIEYLIRQYNTLKSKEHEVDRSGKPIINAKDVYLWLSKIASASASVEDLKERVKKEQTLKVKKIKGGSEIGHYEIPKR